MRDGGSPQWGVPLPPEARIGLDRWNPRHKPEGQGDRFYVASDYILTTLTHWIDGRSVFCCPSTCGVDHSWQNPIWMAYLHVCRPSLAHGGWENFWLRVTPGAARRTAPLGDVAFHLRSRQLSVRRKDTRYNAPVEILLTGDKRTDLPIALDLRPFITQLVQADSLSQEDREARKKRRA